MAIVHQPALLILDEPSTGVDPVSRIDLWRLASEAAAAGAAVLMSTTYLDEAERAAHLVVLDRGRVLVQGSYDQVRAGFAGVVTEIGQPIRAEWAWRRGRVLHEYWPASAPSSPSTPSDPPAGTRAIAPDLEDIVIALSLARRNAVPS
jgi:ABC-2 type transport system ATP-binding protein